MNAGADMTAPLKPAYLYFDGPYAAIEAADVVAIDIEWDAVHALDLERVRQLANAPVPVDLHNIYSPQGGRATDFTYPSVGRV